MAVSAIISETTMNSAMQARKMPARVRTFLTVVLLRILIPSFSRLRRCHLVEATVGIVIRLGLRVGFDALIFPVDNGQH